MTLPDSNVLIHYLKAIEPLTSGLQAASPSETGVPAIAAYELEYVTLRGGNPRRRAMLSRVLGSLEEVAFDAAAAHAAARVRCDLETAGETIGPLDLLIAGTAVSRGAVLDTKQYRRIQPGTRPAHRGLEAVSGAAWPGRRVRGELSSNG